MKHFTLLPLLKHSNNRWLDDGKASEFLHPQARYNQTASRHLLFIFFTFFLCGVFTIQSFAQNSTIQGTVINESGAPVATVSVVVKETKVGTTTDSDGRFTINARVGQTLVFSSVGFVTQEVAIKDLSSLNISLAPSASKLSEVVVVGYGTQKRAALTSAVSSISASQITTTKNENILNTLTGKIPGVRIVQNTSEPGAFNNSFDIRGMTGALIVIDGIPRTDIARIDPNDVESVSVLKDASAAVYGSRAANGVILITTKKGKRGGLELNYTGTYGVQIPTGFPKSADAVQYMTLVNELNMHNVNGGTRIYSDAQIAEYLNGTKQSTDWQKATINRQATQTQHNLSANGGNDNSSYFVSIGYTGQDGILKSNDLFYKRYNLRSNLSTRISKSLTFDLNLSGTMERKDQPMQAAYWVFRSMWYQPPINPVFANNDPKYLNSLPNPLHPVAQSTSDIAGFQVFYNNWFQSSATLNYKVPFVTGLSVKGLYSYDYILNNNKIFNKAYNTYTYNAATNTYAVTGTQQSPSTVRREFFEHPASLAQVSLNYSHSFLNVHNVTALALYEENKRRGDNFNAQRELALPIDQLYAGNSTLQQGTSSSSNTVSYNLKYASYVGVFTYDYKAKYFAKFAFRVDGASKFPEAHQFGFFPDYELGWRVSEEKFFQNINALSFVNNLKFRASYGKTGDDQNLNAYQFLPGFNYPSGGAVFNGTFISGLSNRGTVNPAIFWIKATMLDIGMDAELWNGKLGFSVDYFKRDREGLLATRILTVPDVVGASLPQENINSDQNEGVDFEVSHRSHIGKVNYNVRGTFGFVRIMNKRVERAKLGNSYLNWLQNTNNRYAGVYFGYGEDGRFESYKDIENSQIYVPRGTVVGDYRYQDWNGDGQVGVDDSHPIALTGMPLTTFGLTLGAAYKGIDVNLLFQGAANVRATYLEQLGGPLWAGGNALTMFLDRYHPVDPNADPYSPTTEWVPGYYAYTGTNAYTNTLHNVRNAAYVRLKSAEIGYTIPAKLMSRIGLKGVRVFATGYNVFTITGLKFLDPEHPSVLSVVDQQFGYAYPIDKIFSFGLNIKF